MKANVKYLDIAKVIQAFPHALTPFSNHSCAVTLSKNGNLGHVSSVRGGQAWSEKTALKMDSGVSHGNSHEAAPSAILWWRSKPEAQGSELAWGVGGTVLRSQAWARPGSGARMCGQVLNTGICGGWTGWTGRFQGLLPSSLLLPQSDLLAQFSSFCLGAF